MELNFLLTKTTITIMTLMFQIDFFFSKFIYVFFYFLNIEKKMKIFESLFPDYFLVSDRLR